MTDFLHVAPPADGLARAMHEARTRRYRKAGLSSGVVAAVVSVLALLAGSGGTQRLVQEPQPVLPAVTGVDNHVTREERLPTTRTGTSNTARGVASFEGGATSTGRPSPGPRLEPVGAAVGGVAGSGDGGRAAEKPYQAGPISRYDRSLPLNCDLDPSKKAQRLCPSVSMDEAGGGSWRLGAQVCSTRTTNSVLRFPQRNEVDFRITQLGEELWRWSRWHPYVAAPHQLYVETGACVSWEFLWTAVDATGKKLPQGSYTLHARFLTDDLADEAVQRVTFRIS